MSDLELIDELLGRNRMVLSWLTEQHYQRGSMTDEEAHEWRLSHERWEAIDAGVIEVDERNQQAPVVLLCERRASRARGGA